MRWGRDKEKEKDTAGVEVEEVLDVISTTASELRAEASRRAASHDSMEQIAQRLERLALRLRESDA